MPKKIPWKRFELWILGTITKSLLIKFSPLKYYVKSIFWTFRGVNNKVNLLKWVHKPSEITLYGIDNICANTKPILLEFILYSKDIIFFFEICYFEKPFFKLVTLMTKLEKYGSLQVPRHSEIHFTEWLKKMEDKKR